MDEGKPTKGKWWSRPRPNTGDDGDWHLPAPAPASGGGAVDGAGAPPPAQEASGPGEDSAGPTPPRQTAGAADAGAAPTIPADAPEADAGSYDPALPADAGQGFVGDSGAGSAGPVDGTDAAPDAYDPAPPADAARGLVADSGAGSAQPAGVTDAVPDAYDLAPAGDAPRPLHDPDPYSTPPYGEPGPWALAPPVQHPVATPAHGTATPAAAPQAAYPDASGAAQPPAQLPPTAPTPDPAEPYQATPVPPPHGVTSAPYGEAGQAYPGGPAPVHPPTPGGPAPVHAGTPGGPWQQYDPWAGPVSLSGSGGAVGERPRRGRRALALGALVVALVSGVVGGAIGSYLERNGGTDVELPQAGAESTHRAAGSVAGIAASALPGVVTIHTKGSSEQGTGTGFVLDDRGHILTNNHVVDPAGSDGQISVTFAGGQSADAEVVGHDSGYDLAVIKVSGVRGLKPLPLGNSENVQVGDPVVAIGAPFDLANTVTSGIISAKDRPITAGGEKGDGTDVSYVDALQTDAPINPGNSGGPLVDSKARVIGINSAIRSADSGAELDGGQSGSIGLGFAIPINQAKRVAEELINTGKATHPVIGVTLDMDYSGDGARVGTKGNDGGSAVSPGGPGDKAGLQPGDVITEVDGVRVHTGEELIVKIRAHRPKDKLALTVERGGNEQQVTLVLGSADGN
ncbi:trypsin-like peptidase domain-containing protein [Streptomyces sp. NPDC102467]|uniref:S1C family serine protease n=1 Tax=Streptomyces sp. NPDC102467 TaxID=3366179 RepID=UPI0037FF11F8